MKIALVCANGGHLIEMLQLMDAFASYETFFITFEGEDTLDLKNAYYFEDYRTVWLKFIVIFFQGSRILIKEKPDIIVSTGGGGIAIPICYIGKLLGIKIIFIESFTRVKTKSGGGKYIYPIADLFLVQWRYLLEKYGKKAKYWGRVS